MEKRLIDINPIISNLTAMKSMYDAILIDGMIKALEDAPTVDAVPVVHGRWLSWDEQFPAQTPHRKNNLGVFCEKCHNHNDNRTTMFSPRNLVYSRSKIWAVNRYG